MEQITIKKTVGAEAPETDSYLPIRVSRVEYEYLNGSGKYIKKESNGRNKTDEYGIKHCNNSVRAKISVALTAFKKANKHIVTIQGPKQKITFYGEDGTAIPFEQLGIGVEYKAGEDWVYVNYYGKKYYYWNLKEIDVWGFSFEIGELVVNGCRIHYMQETYKHLVDMDKHCKYRIDLYQDRQNFITETENAFLALPDKIGTMSCQEVYEVVNKYTATHKTKNVCVSEYNIWKSIITKQGMFELLVKHDIHVRINMEPAFEGEKPELIVEEDEFSDLNLFGKLVMELDSLNITPDFIKSFAIQAIIDKLDNELYEQGLIEKEVE